MVVGISCTTETYPLAIRIAEIVKGAYEDCIVVLGGPHVTFEYESALAHNYVDYVVLNEGESSLKKLCDYHVRGIGTIESLKGVAYRRDGVVFCTEPEPFIADLDTLPFPDRNFFENINDYVHPASISTSRGCPGSCVFCAASVLSGKKYRMRSPHNIVLEFEYLKSFGFTHVNVIDDTMTASIERLHGFLDEMISCDLNMTWFCESRVDVMTKDILLKMKAAGLVAIQFGVESGSKKVLDATNKNVNFEQIRNVFGWCKEIDLFAATNVMIGHPEDDLETIKDTLSLAEEISAMGAYVSTTVCTPFPGTPLWLYPERFGIEFADYDLGNYSTFCPVINTKHLTVADIRNEYYNVEISLRKKYPKKNYYGNPRMTANV